MRIGQNTAPEGFVLFQGLEPIGELIRAPQPELDAAALTAGGPEVTLLSVATLIAGDCPYEALPWPIVSSRGQGPILAAREVIALDQMAGRKTATPGPTMTETLLATTLLPTYHDSPVLTSVADSLTAREVDAGVLYDQAQCNLTSLGLVSLEDIGARFAKYHGGLPIPLRVVAVRRDTPSDVLPAIETALREAMHRLEADRGAAVTACAEALNTDPETIDAYLRRTLDPHARLDSPEFQAALDVLREYNDADYYAANGRF